MKTVPALSLTPRSELEPSSTSLEGQPTPSIEPMTDTERTLLETLLAAAFGEQCVRDYEERMKKAVKEYDILPVLPPTPESQSLLALSGVIARGYSLECATRPETSSVPLKTDLKFR